MSIYKCEHINAQGDPQFALMALFTGGCPGYTAVATFSAESAVLELLTHG